MTAAADSRSIPDDVVDGVAQLAPKLPQELTGFRDLLEQLVIEFKKVEAWAQSSCTHNLRPELCFPAIGESVHGNAGPETHLYEVSGPEAAPEQEHHVEECPQQLDVVAQTPAKSEEAIGEDDELAINYELKTWFDKLLLKESRRHEVQALSPKYIHKLFVESDDCLEVDEVSLAETVNCFNAACRVALAEAPYFAKSKTCFTGPGDTIPDGMLSFEAFQELMLWNRVEPHLKVQLKFKAYEIREVLIRHSVDLLIFEFSGLEPGKRARAPPLCLQVIDPTVGCVVVVNALTIGISADHPWDGWEKLEVCYTCFFVCEVFLKLAVYGVRQHFCGVDMLWNIFDLAIVSLAVFDFAVTYIASSADTALSNFTLMRLARLAKITRLLRLIRLVRLKFFKELLLLVKGVVAGMRTLMWAFVLLITLVYVIGIMMRQTVGDRHIQIGDKYDTVLFNSVPWSMFQTFRCFTDDCSLADGTPLLAHLYELYGVAFTIPWAIATLFVTFGVFNLIMAVFVENVQENAKVKRQLTREDERARVVSKMRELVMIFGGRDVDEENARLSQSNVQLSDLKRVDFQLGGIITRDMFNAVIVKPRVHDILDDLEVHVADRTELFDLLDADRSNSVDVSELIHGVLKLRSGGADKSDIVATILGIRSLQKQMTSFMETTFENHASIRRDLKEQFDELKRARQSFRSNLRGVAGFSKLEQPKLKPQSSLLSSL